LDGSNRGGAPIHSKEKTRGFNYERDKDEIKKRNLNTNLCHLKRIIKEPVTHAGGITAVLLQVAHPGVGKGVGRHSNFSTRLLERTVHTAMFIYVMVYGTDFEKQAFSNFVFKAHRNVNDHRTNNSYDALDPRLQLWVAATIYVATVQSYESVFPPLTEDEHDQLYQESSIFGTSLQLPLSMWPADRAAFKVYWKSEIEALRGATPPEAIKIAQDLFHPRYSKVPRSFMPILFFTNPFVVATAIEQLPAHVRTAFGLQSTWKTRVTYKILQVWNRVTVRFYPERVRTWGRDYYLWSLRKKIRSGTLTRNGKSVDIGPNPRD
jgi:uncharacterized protein (DUF2236 family)